MDKKEEGSAQVVEKAEDVVVTLEHPSFGLHVFRCEEGKVQSAIPNALSRAKKVAAVSKEVASIDSQQVDLVKRIAECDQRIEATKVLNDTAREAREKSMKESLQKNVDSLAARRQALFDSLEEK